MRKHLAIAGITAAGLVGGGAAGFALTGTSPLAGAERATTAATDDTTPTTVASGNTATPNGDRPEGTRPDPTARLTEVLAPLVKDGTLTQAQADKVVAALKAAGPMGGGHGPGGRHGGPGLDAAAKALGITADDLRTALQGGKSIADVATDRNVDVSAVIDAMVAEMTTLVTQEVTDGRITQAEADQRLADAKDRITSMVNGQMPAGGPGFGGPGRDHGDQGTGRGTPPQGDAPASDTTTTTEG